MYRVLEKYGHMSYVILGNFTYIILRIRIFRMFELKHSKWFESWNALELWVVRIASAKTLSRQISRLKSSKRFSVVKMRHQHNSTFRITYLMIFCNRRRTQPTSSLWHFFAFLTFVFRPPLASGQGWCYGLFQKDYESLFDVSDVLCDFSDCREEDWSGKFENS